MITTDFLPGSPAWLDLGVTDARTTTSFYGSVFGWDLQPMGPEGDYGLFQLDGRTVGGMGKLTEEGARSAWMIYFGIRDADAAARTVEQRGGQVRVEPMDMDGQGRMAQFTDPQGGQFAVWQAGENGGLDAVDVPGTLVWAELCTTSASAAKDFYGALFGWDTQDMPMPGDGDATYTLLSPAGGGEDMMHGGIVEVPTQYLTQTNGIPYWHPVFGTEDTDATIARVGQAGGKVTMGPEDAEGVGRLAVCSDPAGAEFVVLKPAEM